MTHENTPDALVGWTPIDMDLETPRPWVRWLDLRGLDIAEPMFSGTVQRALAQGRTPKLSPPEALAAVAAAADVIAPTAFVFHGARAGTTLLTMLLRRIAGMVVLNEPQATCMAIAQRDTGAPLPWLAELLACLGQRRGPAQRGLVVVLSSWAILRVRQIQRLFPQVPCVFLYRDPSEVVASLLHHAPKWAHPPRDGLDLLVETPIIGDAHATMADVPFFARAIGGFEHAAASGELRLVEYGQLARLEPEELAAWCGITLASEDRARIAAALPSFLAHEAASEPVRSLDDAAREAVERWAQPAYRVLETRRRASSS